MEQYPAGSQWPRIENGSFEEPDYGDRHGWSRPLQEFDWNSVENWFRNWFNTHPGDHAPLRDLLDKLTELVPKIDIENGFETYKRHLQCDDGPEHWNGWEHLKRGAQILELGELAYMAEGNIPETSETWQRFRIQIEEILREYRESEEVTEGAEELSRATHATRAQELLNNIDYCERAMVGEKPREEHRKWVREFVSEVAFSAFEAGRHTQAAWGKSVEDFADTGMRVRRGASVSGQQSKKKRVPDTMTRLREMDRLIADGHSKARAAEIAASRGLGSSAEANRKLWQRNKKVGT